METPRRNKRTNCSPKPRNPDSSYSKNLDRSIDHEHGRNLTNKLSRTKQNSSTGSKKNRQIVSVGNDGKQINYKVQNYAKLLSEIPEKISREKNRDHIFFSAANSQIFQAKVAYFPGKNLDDIRQVLSSNSKERSDNNSIKSYQTNREKTFGTHLIVPKKKTKKIKLVQKPLNTIQEVNENDKSKESLKRALEPFQDMKETSSIIMTYTDQSDDSKQASVGIIERKEYKYIPNNRESAYGQKTRVSYCFQEDESKVISNEQSQSETYKSKHFPAEFSPFSSQRVFQIKEMFEKLSKTNNFQEKSIPKVTHTINEPIKSIPFEHTISCEECRRILKGLIETESISEKDMAMAMTDMPSNSSRSVVDSLIQEICDKIISDKDDITFKIETKKTTKVQKLTFRRNRKKTRRKGAAPHDMQLNEKKNGA
ncbi:uncharacterized protein LOC123672600 isoform X1 [Harmonia axyridis]|uniref:uncharacterized protein LOC123672600 isoform X1 n=1 Tax=Harmonia axyridis TaxID=115357 RepID=UPI001E2774CF|nr:uncharacterized protein LOC123672600 isoform X1 [Harmonia axyridis]